MLRLFPASEDLNNGETTYFQIDFLSRYLISRTGGPCVDPSKPSQESEKITKSLVLLEFIADISGKLLPADPMLRAKTYPPINLVSNSFDPGLGASVLRSELVKNVIAAVEKIQALHFFQRLCH